MSALAHYLEAASIATVVLSLVRAQSDKMRPPRALWVPFELGRPLGEPNDAHFQRNVLRALLGLLERPAGPFTEDYAVDAPGAADAQRWAAPALAGGGPTGSITAELAALAPYHAAFAQLAGRSTVGVSGLDLAAAAAYVSGFPDGPRPPACAQMSDLLRLRFAADDLKAHYLEAASAPTFAATPLAPGSTGPSSRQLQRWLWTETALGAELAALRARALASGDEKFETVGGRLIIPADWRG